MGNCKCGGGSVADADQAGACVPCLIEQPGQAGARARIAYFPEDLAPVAGDGAHRRRAQYGVVEVRQGRPGVPGQRIEEALLLEFAQTDRLCRSGRTQWPGEILIVMAQVGGQPS